MKYSEKIAVDLAIHSILEYPKNWHFESLSVFQHKSGQKIWFCENSPTHTHFYYDGFLSRKNAKRLSKEIRDWIHSGIVKDIIDG